jgi:predicted amidohydrolase
MLLLPGWGPAVHAQPASATRPAATQPVGEGARTVRVAAVQCSSDLGAVEANRAKLAGLAEEAARQGAKIIVLPETAVTGYLSQDLRTNWHLPGRPLEQAFRGKDPLPTAEPVPGPSTDFFCRLADRLDVYLTIPLLEIDRTPATQPEGDRTPRLFNTVCLASPEEAGRANYRKLTHGLYPETSWARRGDRGVAML